MAITLKNFEQGGPGGELTAESLRIVIANITLDNAYPTGGSPGLRALLGLQQVYAVFPLHHFGYVLEYYPESDKLKFYQQPAAAAAGAMPEVPNNTNLSAFNMRILVLGV